jgi:hypothetical protein
LIVADLSNDATYAEPLHKLFGPRLFGLQITRLGDGMEGCLAAAVGILLEGLQFLTPDRTPQLMGAFYSAPGALAAALVAVYVTREGKDEQSQ